MLRQHIADNSVDCVVTSPPYWMLRDYGTVDQIGLEFSFEEYVSMLCDVFDEVKRVLKPGGTCWVNLADTFASPNGMRNDGFNARWHGTKYAGQKQAATDAVRPARRKTSLPAKSLCLIPFRFAIEMVKRRWGLRNVIIWQKPNCMPSSAKDRFTIDFEYLLFFTKSKRYHFAPQYEPHCEVTQKRVESFRRNHERFNPARHKHSARTQNPFEVLQSIATRGLNPLGRNKRCVWSIPTQPFSGGHFAVYPEKLCETPILAGCPVGGLVLDPFFGTGTTGVVALKLNRQFLGIELNPEYIKMAQKRLTALLQQQAGQRDSK